MSLLTMNLHHPNLAAIPIVIIMVPRHLLYRRFLIIREPVRGVEEVVRYRRGGDRSRRRRRRRHRRHDLLVRVRVVRSPLHLFEVVWGEPGGGVIVDIGEL